LKIIQLFVSYFEVIILNCIFLNITNEIFTMFWPNAFLIFKRRHFLMSLNYFEATNIVKYFQKLVSELFYIVMKSDYWNHSVTAVPHYTICIYRYNTYLTTLLLFILRFHTIINNLLLYYFVLLCGQTIQRVYYRHNYMEMDCDDIIIYNLYVYIYMYNTMGNIHIYIMTRSRYLWQ